MIAFIARHNEDRSEVMPLVSKCHQAQKTEYQVLIRFQNVRLFNNKREDVLEFRITK